MLPIASTANERVRYARSLLRERVRDGERCFLVEGVRLVEEALRAGARPVLAFYTEGLAEQERGQALVAALRQTGAAALPVTERVMASLSETVTPQGVLAVVPVVERPWPEAGLVLVLDGLRDPGNAGTILRTAWAAGVAAVAATQGTVDLYAPKVVRAAMGAHWHLPLRWGLTGETLRSLLVGRETLLAEQRGIPYWQVEWRGPQALIVGGEARGPELAVDQASRGVAVPMEEGVESLNVAVAAAVILFEARRQREAEEAGTTKARRHHDTK